MRTIRKMIALSVIPVASGCATMSVSMSSVDPGGPPVSASASTFNIFGLNPISVDRLNQLRSELIAQCDGDDVTGIITRTSTIYAILGVIEKVEVSGICD